MGSKKNFYALLILVQFVGCLISGFPLVMGQDIEKLEEKAWLFINNVLTLDVKKYNVSARPLFPPTELGFRPIVDLTYTFRSAESEIVVNPIFEGGNIASCFIYFNAGTPFFTEKMPEDALEKARLILDRYKRWFEAKHVENMLRMLSDVEKIENYTKIKENMEFIIENYTKIEGNMKFMILRETNKNTGVTIIHIRGNHWENGIEFKRKTTGITFGPRDWVFVDTWNLYKVGSAELRVSMEDAVRMAKEAVKNFTYTAADYEGKTVVVGNFTVLDKPLYVDLGTDSRGKDYYMLYPFWEVYLCLDKMYLGGVTGLRVLIWADTGEMAGIYPTGGFAAPPTEGTNKETSPQQGEGIAQIIAVAATAITATFLAAVITKKRRRL